MVHKTVIAGLLILGMPTALLLIYDALMLRSRPAPLESRDFWVFLGGASVILIAGGVGFAISAPWPIPQKAGAQDGRAGHHRLPVADLAGERSFGFGTQVAKRSLGVSLLRLL